MIEHTILAHLVFNEAYAPKVLPFIKADYFSNRDDRVLFELIVGYISSYKALPTKEALFIDLDKVKDLNEEQFKNVREKIAELKIDPKTDEKWLLDRTEEFCSWQAIKNALFQSIRIVDGKEDKLDKGSIPRILQDALAVSFDTHVGHDFIEDWGKRFDHYHENCKRVEFDLASFNRITKGGFPSKSLNVFMAGTYVGKAQPLDIMIPTPCGPKRFGSLHVGDYVYGSDGKPTRVTGVFLQGRKEVYRLTFSDGRQTECCGEHLWRTFYSKTKEWKVSSLNEIIDHWNRAKSARTRTYVQLTEPIEGQKENETLRIDPYVLGLFIGDGYSGEGGLALTSADSEIQNAWISFLRKHGCHVRKKEIGFFGALKKGRQNPVVSLLKYFNLYNKRSYEKMIPARYLRASVSDRIALLQGLMDTDGTVTTNGAVSFTTTSPYLAEQVVDLVRGLGGRADTSSRYTSYTHKGERRTGRHSFTIRMRFGRAFPLFRLARKQQRLASTYRGGRTLKLRLEGIEKVEIKECQCISVDSPDHLYLTNDYIVTHNSLVLCHLAAANLASGYNVLYITLEMSEIGDPSIAQRIDANLMDIALDELALLPRDSYEKKIEKLKTKVKGKLIIKEYPTATAGANHFRYLLNELHLKKNFIPDIVYVDYLTLCSSTRVKHSQNVGPYSYFKSVAEELRGLAQEFEIPIVSAAQLNRAGFKDSDAGMEHTADSWGLPQTADFLAIIFSNEQLERLGQFMIKQEKNRYANKALTQRFVIGVDKSKMRLYDIDTPQISNVVDISLIDKPSSSKFEDWQ